MSGAVSGSLAVALPVLYITFLVSLVVATRAELTAICEGSRFGVAGGCLASSLYYLMVSLVVATRAELTARCEGSRFGVAGGFLTNSLHSPYGFLSGRHTGRIDSKM